jgi:putative DNA primase/helicase
MNFDNIPQEIKKLDRWVCWNLEQKKEGFTKIPKDPNTGKNASASNPSTWGNFDTALDAMTQKGWTGIGFMFNGDGLQGVDIDGCRDPETGELTDEARDIIFTLDSYTEVSQSGRGIHILCYGPDLPAGKRRSGHVEMYDRGRYFCMTGAVIDDGHADIEERGEELRAVHAKCIDRKAPPGVKSTERTNHERVELSETETVGRIRASKQGSMFDDLMAGRWESRYQSQSEADMAMCNILAFWCMRDPRMMDSIFRQSGLMRPKWGERHGHDTYGNITIATAIRDCREVYSGPASGVKPTHWTPAPSGEGWDETDPGETVPPIASAYIGTDMDRAAEFTKAYKGSCYWCQDTKSWMIWCGTHWRSDRTLMIHSMAKTFMDSVVADIKKALFATSDEEQKAKLTKQLQAADKGRSYKGITQMLELVKSDLPITASQFDADPHLLNCRNGIVNLKTGELLPHEPGYLMSMISGANYIPGKPLPRFQKYLDIITCGDKELQKYLQMICGMAAIGKVYYEGVCVFFGNGRNGKSTFLNTMLKVFGDYGYSMNPEVLLVQRDGAEKPGKAEVRGKRFVTATETEEGKRLSSQVLKQLGSTDTITAKRLYENPITFEPSHTLILSTNHLPKVSSTDSGTWRRIAVVPFLANIQSIVTKEIKDYASVLYHEDGDGILGWIVEGARAYIAAGYDITLPKAVTESTNAYREAENWLENYMGECCTTTDKKLMERGSILYDSYSEWCRRNNEYCRRNRDFAQAMEAAGYCKVKKPDGMYWIGIKVNAVPSTELLPSWRGYSSAR